MRILVILCLLVSACTDKAYKIVSNDHHPSSKHIVMMADKCSELFKPEPPIYIPGDSVVLFDTTLIVLPQDTFVVNDTVYIRSSNTKFITKNVKIVDTIVKNDAYQSGKLKIQLSECAESKKVSDDLLKARNKDYRFALAFIGLLILALGVVISRK